MTQTSTPFARHGALRVQNGRLTDAHGEPFALRGVSTHSLGLYAQYVNLDSFRTLRDDWGANVIRLAMYTMVENGYLDGGDPAELERVIDEGVRCCRELGMYAIVDWHILTDGNPMLHQPQALDFFKRMSAKYAGEPHVLYEICNEPNGEGVDWEVVRGYAETVIPVIRANAPEALILCGTPCWSQDVDHVAAHPLEDGNVMYSLHYYAATHKDGLRDKLERALADGTPVFVSEFSICDASGNGEIDYESAEAWRALILRRGLSYIGWNLSNKDESSAMIRPDCDKTSGWTVEELSDTARWLRNALREDKE